MIAMLSDDDSDSESVIMKIKSVNKRNERKSFVPSALTRASSGATTTSTTEKLPPVAGAAVPASQP